MSGMVRSSHWMAASRDPSWPSWASSDPHEEIRSCWVERSASGYADDDDLEHGRPPWTLADDGDLAAGRGVEGPDPDPGGRAGQLELARPGGRGVHGPGTAEVRRLTGHPAVEVVGDGADPVDERPALDREERDRHAGETGDHSEAAAQPSPGEQADEEAAGAECDERYLWETHAQEEHPSIAWAEHVGRFGLGHRGHGGHSLSVVEGPGEVGGGADGAATASAVRATPEAAF